MQLEQPPQGSASFPCELVSVVELSEPNPDELLYPSPELGAVGREAGAEVPGPCAAKS